MHFVKIVLPLQSQYGTKQIGKTIFEIYRGVEQLVARRAHNPEVVGSSPASATKKELMNFH